MPCPLAVRTIKISQSSVAFLESLFYTISSFGLLIYLLASEHAIVHFACGFLGIISAWLAIQLIYSQEYAVRYYHDGKGLVFPDCDRPNWTEFLYQGFCMVACYQTSDTSINSTAMRRLVATDGMLSYFLSVSIIAIIFGMIGNLL
ncbi:probable transmembrane protein [Microcystis aeruginosa NIES-44]|uniref:Probable transmembrane protein n=1 Tax=Microcystis aeruginosa NIES-44 TaxID=449439 RepID=A0A0A1VS85_MICAE|nr:probable transmembrane protein [Microcystis aeruginosa NIES-44]